MKFAKILPFSYPDILTYSVPRNLIAKARIGQVVKIPLGKKETKGVIFEFLKNRPLFKTKPIIDVPDSLTLFTETQIKLAKWLSLYYFSSLYQVLKNIKPEGLENAKGIKKQEDEKLKNMSLGKKIILFGNVKKEVAYLKVAQKFLKAKKQVLILFPDYLSLENFLKKTSKNLDLKKTAIITGKTKNEEKQKEWFKIKTKEKLLILGTRTACFYPFTNLGLIIVDQEYEDGYLQEKTPKYDVREVAEFLQKITGCTLILQTDILTLENFYRLKNGYQIAKIKNRKIKYKVALLVSDNFTILEDIQSLIKKNLERNKKVILFLNKKGRNIFVLCRNCGFSPACPDCKVPLSVSSTLLTCNHCGFKKEVPLECENCGSVIVKKYGVGTEKLEEAAKSAFLKNKILRIDETTKKNVNSKLIKEAQIIVGTKLLKNISFKNVGLFVFFSIDNLLNLPTYRAAELTQKTLASFLARLPKDALAVIKTANPKHPLLKAAQKQSFKDFFKEELKNLKKFHYPPFYDFIQIVLSGKNQKDIEKEALKLKNSLKKYEILGPFIPYISQKRKLQRLALVVKAPKDTIFYDKMFKLTKNISVTRNPEKIL